MSNSVNLSLDVTKTGIQNPLIKVRQGDGGFETLHTTVTSNGEPLDLQGWTITFMGTTAGNHKIVDANVKVVEAPNGIFDYTPSKAWGMDIGEFKMAYFKFVKGDGSASSANFRVSVIEAVDLTQEEAKNYISVVDATIAEAKQHLTDSLASVTASVAATSSAASSLAISVSNTASSAVNKVNTTASSAVNQVNTTASSAVNQVNSAASNASSIATSAVNNVSTVASNAVANVNSASNTYVKKSGDTMTGNLTAPQVIANDLLTGFHNVIQVPSTTTKIIDLINNDFINGRGFWKEATYIAFNNPLSDAPTTDAYSIIKLATRGVNRTYVEYSDLSGNVWHANASTNTLSGWVKQANDAEVVHKTGTETIAGDKTFTGKTTADNFVSNGTPVNTVKSTTSTMWYSSTLTAYRTGNTVTIVNNKQDTSTIPDNNTSTETIPLGYRPASVLFYPAIYGASLKGELQINANGTFTARGAINGQYRLTATYVTSDPWPV